jgi:hypothetical protein
VVSSLLEDGDLEAIEVGSVSSGFFGSQFLAPSAVGKLGLDVRSSDGLGQQGLSGVTRNLDDVISKAQTLEVNSLALNTSDGLRTINKGSVGINDVDDDTKFADISAVVDQGNSADLNKTSERRAHFYMLLKRVVSPVKCDRLSLDVKPRPTREVRLAPIAGGRFKGMT